MESCVGPAGSVFDERWEYGKALPKFVMEECHFFAMDGVKASNGGRGVDRNLVEHPPINGWEVHGRIGLDKVAVRM